jgi:sugar phosphate isomerase/epimerase
MQYFTRRKFIHTSSALLASSFTLPAFFLKKNLPSLAFSTLGCPDWDFKKITDFAHQHNYRGIELRGIQREMDLTKCDLFKNENLSSTLSIMKEKKLKFVDLGSSTNLHIREAEERKKNLDEARRFIDLANMVHCPYVRVFPNKIPDQNQKDKTIDLMVSGLLELGEFAKQKNVFVLMETHGDLVQSDDILRIMQSVNHSHVGLVWDVANMWTITKEPPVEVYQKLKKYIRHTHLKDATVVDGKITYRLLGEGEVPIFEAIDELVKNGYKGYYSFEWEKLWHPELADPEIAFAHFSSVMRKHFLY